MLQMAYCKVWELTLILDIMLLQSINFRRAGERIVILGGRNQGQREERKAWEDKSESDKRIQI